MSLPCSLRVAPAAVVVALAAMLPGARADILIDNLAQPLRATTLVADDLWAAQSFTTAAGPVRLDAVTLPLGLPSGDPRLLAELRADDAGLPGSLLATLGFPGLGAGAPVPVSLGIPAATVLAAGTPYWLVLGATGGGFGWSYAGNNVWDGPGALGNYAYSSDAGASWANFGSDFPYFARIEVSAVPEPMAVLLWGGGLLALALRRTPRRGGPTA